MPDYVLEYSETWLPVGPTRTLSPAAYPPGVPVPTTGQLWPRIVQG